MIKVTFEGYNEKREKMQLVKIGDLVKETEKQIILIIYHIIFYLSIISQIFSIYCSK